jgi:hypothetical protein
VLQTPFGPVQCVLFKHCTHLFVVVRQTGNPAGHAARSVALHSTHLPETQAGLFGSVHVKVAAEPLSPLQGTHVLIAVSQIGFAPMHAAGFAAVHSTHLSVVVLQTLFVPVHRIAPPTPGRPAVHSTHAPVDLQAGNVFVAQGAVAPVPLLPVHATQSPPPSGTQTGFVGVAAQFVAVLHSLQLPPTQKGVVPPQSAASVRHWTQTPAALHFGVAPPHSASLRHFETHLLPMQNGATGFNPTQSRAAVHWTHAWFGASQTGVGLPVSSCVPAHWGVVLHCLHVPPTHAGRAAVGH